MVHNFEGSNHPNTSVGTLHKIKLEKQLEEIVKRNYQLIFKDDFYYTDSKIALKTVSGKKYLPDAYGISLSQDMYWCIYEFELAEHSFSSHIAPQLTKFLSIMKNKAERRKIIDLLYKEIKESNSYTEFSEKQRKNDELYKVISDTIYDKDPIIFVISDLINDDLIDFANLFKADLRLIEIKTYKSNQGDEVIYHHVIKEFEKVRKFILMERFKENTVLAKEVNKSEKFQIRKSLTPVFSDSKLHLYWELLINLLVKIDRKLIISEDLIDEYEKNLDFSESTVKALISHFFGIGAIKKEGKKIGITQSGKEVLKNIRSNNDTKARLIVHTLLLERIQYYEELFQIVKTNLKIKKSLLEEKWINLMSEEDQKKKNHSYQLQSRLSWLVALDIVILKEKTIVYIEKNKHKFTE